MDNNKFLEALAQVQELEKRRREEAKKLKERKKVVVLEYTSQFSNEQRAEMIERSRKILTALSVKAQQAREVFRATMKELKQEAVNAKSTLSLLSYEMDNGLKRVKNSFDDDKISQGILIIKREGINDIEANIKEPNWYKTTALKLATALNIDVNSGVVRSIMYDANNIVKIHNNK